MSLPLKDRHNPCPGPLIRAFFRLGTFTHILPVVDNLQKTAEHPKILIAHHAHYVLRCSKNI